MGSDTKAARNCWRILRRRRAPCSCDLKALSTIPAHSTHCVRRRAMRGCTLA